MSYSIKKNVITNECLSQRYGSNSSLEPVVVPFIQIKYLPSFLKEKRREDSNRLLPQAVNGFIVNILLHMTSKETT